jgi:hypothetical protein
MAQGVQGVEEEIQRGKDDSPTSVNWFWWLSEPECSEQFRTVYTILVSMPHCWIRGYSQNKIYFKILHLYMEVPVKCLSPKMDWADRCTQIKHSEMFKNRPGVQNEKWSRTGP